MRQFLLATASSGAGSVAFYSQHTSGVKTALTTNDVYRGGGTLVLTRTAADGGDIVLPFHTNNFSYAKSVYSAGTKRAVSLVFEDITTSKSVGRSFTLILVVKGKQFNERNKYSHSFYLEAGRTVGKADLKAYFKKWVENLDLPISITGSGDGDFIVTSTDKNFNFNIIGGDEWFCLEFWTTVSNRGVHKHEGTTKAFVPAQNDADTIDELASKAAADRGFEYTFHSAAEYLYPSLWGAKKTPDDQYTVFTLRFAEPRDVKTRDEVVNQIVQVAFPSTVATENFEALCQMLSTGAVVPDTAEAAANAKGMSD